MASFENGSNNRIVTATGTDAMNAEANLTFDGSELSLTGTLTVGVDDTNDLQHTTWNIFSRLFFVIKVYFLSKITAGLGKQKKSKELIFYRETKRAMIFINYILYIVYILV